MAAQESGLVAAVYDRRTSTPRRKARRSETAAPGRACLARIVPLLPSLTGGGAVTKSSGAAERFRPGSISPTSRSRPCGFVRRALLDPPERTALPLVCRACPELEHDQTVEIVASPAYAWRQLGLVEPDGTPTRRGVVFGFFQAGEGLAIAAALEDETYPIDDLVFDLANIRAGPRFAGEDAPLGGRLGALCQRVYERADHPGYLEMGVPVHYGAGASEVMRDVVDASVGSLRDHLDSLRHGDIERALMEWRSLLRHIVAAPDLEWDRWHDLKSGAHELLRPGRNAGRFRFSTAPRHAATAASLMSRRRSSARAHNRSPGLNTFTITSRSRSMENDASLRASCLTKKLRPNPPSSVIGCRRNGNRTPPPGFPGRAGRESVFRIPSIAWCRRSARWSRALLESEPVNHQRLQRRARSGSARSAGRVCRANSSPFIVIPTNEPWCRDHGPIFLTRDKDPRLAIVDWDYNAWGGKYPPCDLDEVVPTRVAEKLGLPVYYPRMILEGGSIEVNGAGALLTTEGCLLNPNRNPQLVAGGNRAAVARLSRRARNSLARRRYRGRRYRWPH